MSAPEASGHLDRARSALDQAPVLIAAVEGSRLLDAAWTEGALQIYAEVFGGLGASVDANEMLVDNRFVEALRVVVDTGEPVTLSGLRLSLSQPDGTRRDRFLDLRCSPWREDDGSVRGVIGAAWDVTERVLARQGLEHESARWQGRFESSRESIRTLQASLLPRTVPVLPGLQLAARSVVAEADGSAGGDWFSAVPLEDGRLALVVGDVVGHGATATATMGQLRAVLEAMLQSGHDIVESLTDLDRFVQRLPSADAASVCVAVVDPRTGELVYCTAGHPAPLLVTGRSWSPLPRTGSAALGSGGGFATERSTVPPGGLLLLYTDGLADWPETSLEQSLAELGDVANDTLGAVPSRGGAPTHTAESVCEHSIEVLMRGVGHTDDLLVLAAHRVAPMAPLDLPLPGDERAISRASTALGDWLDAAGAGDDDRLVLRMCVVELVTNCLEHGLAGRPEGTVHVVSRLRADGSVELVVGDDGQWRSTHRRPPSFSGIALRGLGLPLVRSLVDDLHVDRGPSGTTVVVHRRLGRPAALATDDRRAPPTPALEAPLTIEMEADHPSVVRVSGPLLGDGADRLHNALMLASRGGTEPVRVDLNQVTHLLSRAVRVLQRARRSAVRDGVPVEIVAEPDSPAGQVLALVGMPTESTRPESTSG